MGGKRILSLGGAVLLIGAVGLTWSPAHAQQAAETAQAQSAGGLENIVVTAQKRQENVQEVPIAIEAFNEHMIDALQITNLDAVAENSPGLELTRNLGGAQFALRGVGGFGITPGIESDVAMFVDGVYVPAIAAAAFTFNNISRTEVDKGPQGTLFGRNALGGVIQIETKDPTQTPHIDADIGYGNYNTVTGNFYGTTGITDHLAADLALYGENQADGWGKNLASASAPVGPQPWHLGYEGSARSKWLFTPDDATKVTFIADADRDRVNQTGPNYIPGANVATNFNAGPAHIGGFYDVDLPNGYVVDNRQYGISLTIDHDFGWGDGKSITSWRRNKFEVNDPQTEQFGVPYNLTFPAIGQYPNSTIIAAGVQEEQDASEEFDLTAPTASTIKWATGIFLYEDRALNNNAKGATNATSVGPYQASLGNNWENVTHTFASQETTSYAAFGQATAPIMPDTRLTVGYRYTIDTRQIAGGTNNQLGTILTTAASNPSGTSKTFPKPTYKLVVDHDLAEDVLVFLSFSRGFQSGAYNVVSGATSAVVQPETMDAYELGVKSDLLDHTLRVNASAFLYNLNNYVATQYVNNAPISVNAAKTQYEGIDFDITYAASKQLTLTLGADLLDPKYISFPGSVYYTLTAPGSLAIYANFPGNAAGNQVAYTEKVESTASAQYRIPTDFGDVYLVGSMTYHSGIVFDAQNLLKQVPYYLANASATWTAPNGQWDVKLWSKNLTGTEYAETLGANTNGFTMNPGFPRTFGVNVGYHWN